MARQPKHRSGRLFLELRVGELHDVSKSVVFFLLILVASFAERCFKLARFAAASGPISLPEAACLCFAVLQVLLAAIPKRRTTVAGDGHVRITDFDEITFKLRFRFRREHVSELLEEFDLLDWHGQPKLLRVFML
jgi:hypothetical protein